MQIYNFIIGGVKENICINYILQNKNFYTFFYHWSYYYRNAFQRILVFHIENWINQEYNNNNINPQANKGKNTNRSKVYFAFDITRIDNGNQRRL